LSDHEAEQSETHKTKRLSDGILLHSEADRLKTEKTKQKRRRRTLRELQVWFNGILMVATIVTAVIVMYQNRIMRLTLIETQRQSDAAIEAARIARESLRSADESFTRMLREMQVQSKASQAVAGASSANAEAAQRSARIAETALRVTEIASLQPEAVNCINRPLSLKTEIEVFWRNTGRTGANPVQTVLFLSVPEVQQYPVMREGSAGAVGAGGQARTAPVHVGKTLTETGLELVNKGAIPLHLWGWAKYRDTFGGWHLTIFNYRYRPNTDCSFDVLWVSNQ